MPKKLEGWALRDFSILSQNSKKIEGGTFGKKDQKSHYVEKTGRVDSLVSPGIVCHAKKRKTFLVQFARPNGSI